MDIFKMSKKKKIDPLFLKKQKKTIVLQGCRIFLFFFKKVCDHHFFCPKKKDLNVVF